MFAEKACFDVLYTCKATSLSKMARLVWRYSDDARAIIENVYKVSKGAKIRNRIKYMHGGKEVCNETVTESCMGQDLSTHLR